MSEMFKEFMNKEVKAPYKDGKQTKVARGILEIEDEFFIKIRGNLGVIVINKNDLGKMSRVIKK